MSFAPAPAKSGNSIAEAMPFLESGMVLPLWTRSLRLGFKAKIGSIFSINKNRAGKPFSLPCAVFIWSEWRDLNSRPLDPQSSALPTAPHPVICFLQRILSYHRCPQKARLFIKKSAFYRLHISMAPTCALQQIFQRHQFADVAFYANLSTQERTERIEFAVEQLV